MSAVVNFVPVTMETACEVYFCCQFWKILRTTIFLFQMWIIIIIIIIIFQQISCKTLLNSKICEFKVCGALATTQNPYGSAVTQWNHFNPTYTVCSQADSDYILESTEIL